MGELIALGVIPSGLQNHIFFVYPRLSEKKMISKIHFLHKKQQFSMNL